MHPVLKRILINGGLTAVLLALIGLLFTHMASVWTSGTAGPRSPDATPPVPDVVRWNVPLMMALWGFVFVAVCELIRWRFVRAKPEMKPAVQQPDDVEKLLNELLAQAESRLATEGQNESHDFKNEEKKPEEMESKPQ